MLAPTQRSTGRRYTATVALLLLAFLVSPAYLLVVRPVGALQISLAALCSSLCIALAWFSWNRWSRLSISTVHSMRD